MAADYENAVKLAIIDYETNIAPRIAINPKDPAISEWLEFLVNAPEPVRREFLASFGSRKNAILGLLRPDQRARLPKPSEELHEAAHLRQSDVAAALLAAGADPRACDRDGREPLQLAIEGWSRDRAAQFAIVRMLLDAGASPNAEFSTSVTVRVPLSSAAVYAETDDDEMVKLLLARGADPNRGCPLVDAVKQGRFDIVRTLLAAKADPNQREEGGATALLCSVTAVEDVIERHHQEWSERRENFNDSDQAEVRHRMFKITKSLLEAGADRSLADGQGHTPLTAAERRGDEKLVKLLAGADFAQPLR